MSERIKIRAVSVDNVTLDEAAEVVAGFLNEEGAHAVYTPNAEIVQACIEDASLAEIFKAAELVIPDGAGVVLASKLLGTPLKAKTPGIELGVRTIELCEKMGKKIYLLGGKPGIAEEAAKRMKEKYPDAIFCGHHDGYFNKENEENDAVIEDIKCSEADAVFVCFGAPAQEKWIAANRDKLPGVHVLLGLGGSLDNYAGVVQRAPDIFIKLNLEWFYRLLKEPYRIGRMMKLPKFILGVIFRGNK